MDADRWASLKALFEQAIALEGPELATFLEQVETHDPELHAELTALLAADATTQSLDSGPLLSLPPDPTPDQRIGSHVGPWRITSQLGAGGMGVVYCAERDDGQFEQTVALKVLRRGMDTESILARFHRERQILAGLEHPSIARLVDGGMTDDGLPWFTMEYVAGTDLTRHCDVNRLSINERLGLFETVCAAVQYAQERLVVHRDLKPSNVLVADDGTVKLLDFGIARVVSDDGSSGHTTVAGTSGALTPAYAAPEQLTGDVITTATDVYALGTILFELLVGHRPRDTDAHGSHRPSECITRTQHTVSAARSVQPDQLRRRLSGDLDNICLKALRDDPTRRYATAGELLEDVRRHRSGHPVLARPDTLGYRASRFAARNRAAVLGTATALLIIGATASAYTVRLTEERDRARLEAAQFQAMASYFTSVFQQTSPLRDELSALREPTVADLLDWATRNAESQLGQYPAAHAQVLTNLAYTYRTRGDYERAVPLLREALDLVLTVSNGTVNDEVVQLTSGMGTTLAAMGRYAEAEASFLEAVEWSRSYPVYNGHAVAFGLNNLAKHLTRLGRYAEAAPHLAEATDIYADVRGDRHEFHAIALANYARALWGAGRLEPLDSMLNRSLEDKWAAWPEGDLSIAEDQYTLSRLRRLEGDPAAALALADSALRARSVMTIDDKTDYALSLQQRGLLLVETGEGQAGLADLVAGDSLFRSAPGEARPLTFEGALRLGIGFSLMGLEEQAIVRLQQAIDEADAFLPLSHPDRGRPRLELGLHHLRVGAPESAEPPLREALDLLEASLPADHWLTARARGALGIALARMDRSAEARLLLADAVKGLSRSLGEGHRFTLETMDALASIE
jgi:eukaryotic-like serine/threonine-protein kinase